MSRELLRTQLASVEIERQGWCVRDQIPLDVITILAGMAGIAKSTILAWYVAGLTRGTLPGDFYGAPIPVAIIAGEDDISRMLVPRLKVAGADLNLVTALSGVRVTEQEGDWITSPNLSDDMTSIRTALIETGARLLIIDPIISLMRGDSHRLEDVRRNLDPLASMAAELDIAIVCVAHFNKGGGQASDKVSGSHAFRDIARSMLLLAVDEETDNRILSVEKSNYSPVKPSLAFRVDSVEVPTKSGEMTMVGQAVMLGDSSLTVQDILNRDLSVLGERSSDLIDYVNRQPEGARAEDVAVALDIPINQARTYLSRAASSGRIARAERGVYTALRNTDATTADPVGSVASVANPSPPPTYATHATDVTGPGDVAKAVANGVTPYCSHGVTSGSRCSKCGGVAA
ncbi:AAA family ATPase [Microbacterium sp. K24]|uniref:AAA family ATPase n=1 Tax=Microbacterium sp. K24 TaxID=2305446 RepID=UPI00109C2B87|nr:AAA family ATPase [Microbacterium sp. K24]